MSRIDDSVEERRAQLSPDRRHVLNMIKRMTVKLTSGVFWQVLGPLLLDGKTRETIKAEIYSGIGFYSRPAPGANVEAIVGFGGAAENPAIVATRDEDTRRRVAKLDQDETATYNTVTIVHHKKEGFVEIRAPGGVAFKLPTLEDYENLRAAFNAHTHLYAPGPGTPVPTDAPTPNPSAPEIPVPAPEGTEVLKAQ